MSEKPASSQGPEPRPDRDQRLKAALKANMARRKAQARARADGATETAETPGDQS